MAEAKWPRGSESESVHEAYQEAYLEYGIKTFSRELCLVCKSIPQYLSRYPRRRALVGFAASDASQAGRVRAAGLGPKYRAMLLRLDSLRGRQLKARDPGGSGHPQGHHRCKSPANPPHGLGAPRRCVAGPACWRLCCHKPGREHDVPQ